MVLTDKKVFVVDGDVKGLEIIGETLGSLDLEVTCFVRPTKCLARLRSEKCDLLIADVKTPEMDGIELVAQVRRHAPWVPVLLVIDQGDVPTAVRAVKAGAEDVIEQPLDRNELINKVTSVLQENASNNTGVGRPLTEIQMKVLKLIVDGRSNREMADLLERSIRTIEEHRANMMEKLGARNLLDLIKRAVSLGLLDLSDYGESGKRTGNSVQS